jgi:DNA-directed RNA polymerase beta' subunit
MQLKFYNLEEAYDSRMTISNAEIMDKNGNFTEDGLYSEKIFGTISGEELEYACLCGEVHGKMMEGMICQKCGSAVFKKQSSLSKLAWIDLGENKIMNARMLPFLYSYFGQSRLKRYIYGQLPIDTDGNVITNTEEEGKKNKDPMPDCVGIGVANFINNFDAILEYYRSSVNKDLKKPLYDFIVKEKENLFISKIPVFSPRLRPVVVKGDKVITDPMNEKYVQLVKLTAGLNSLKYDRTDMSVFAYLNKIQAILEEVDTSVILALNGKKGLIRNTVLGSRLNFSSRCVLTPLGVGTAMEDVHLPYIVVLELFKLEIMNYLRTKYSISFFEAMSIFNEAIMSFNKEIYDHVNSFLGKSGMPILINRNPTIAIGSILYMKLRHIKDDTTDLSMSIRPNILKYLNADHDGDVLNIYRMIMQRQIKAFEKFSPKNFVFSMDNGKFHPNMGLSKDYALGLQTLLSPA